MPRRTVYTAIIVCFMLGIGAFACLLIFDPIFRSKVVTSLTLDSRKLPVVPKGIIRFHEMLGWIPSAGTELTSKTTGEAVIYRINKYGMRDDEMRLDKKPNVLRIAMFGDSYTFGYGINMRDHYTTMLESRFRDTEVLNFGVDAYGIDQSFLRFKYHGLAFQPDIAILFVPHYGGYRHMYDNRFGRNKPKFELLEGNLWLVKPLVPVGPRRGNFSETPRNENSDEFKKALQAMAEHLVLQMKTLANEKGIEFVLVSRVNALTAFALKENIHVVNANETGEQQYHLSREFGHLNRAGNILLADLIQEFLQSNQLAGSHSL